MCEQKQGAERKHGAEQKRGAERKYGAEQKRETGMNGMYWQASYTIEASIVVPILLTVWCAILWLGFQLHDEVKETAARQEELQIDTMQEIWERDIAIRVMGE